jgi:UV DNA damage endonuclease
MLRTLFQTSARSLALRTNNTFLTSSYKLSPLLRYQSTMVAAKRKRAAAAMPAAVPSPPPNGITNPQANPEIIDAPNAYRASPDSDVDTRMAPGPIKSEPGSESPLSDVPDAEPPAKKRNTKKGGATAKTGAAVKKEKDDAVVEATPKKTPVKKAAKANDDMDDPEAEDFEEADEAEVNEASRRPPPVNSDYLPLPWKGRLGYVRFELNGRDQKLSLTVTGLLEYLPPL